MNKVIIAAFIGCICVLAACQKDIIPSYTQNDQSVAPTEWGKDSLKSQAAFITSLHQILFEQNIDDAALNDMICVMNSIGDQQLANEYIASYYLHSPNALLPTEQTMRNQPLPFIKNTYLLFLLREATPAEQEWWVRYIDTHANLTPLMVYHSFATCKEYTLH